MRKLAICDDSRAWLERAAKILKGYLKEQGKDAQVLCFDDIDKCIEELPEDTGVLFMDIEWERKYAFDDSDTEGSETGGKDLRGSAADSNTPDGIRAAGAVRTDSQTAVPEGIRAAAKINRRYPGYRIVYLTNHLGYALDVYQTEHAWYVLKEQLGERLPEIFAKLETEAQERLQELIVRTDGNTTVNIKCSDILYAEREGRKTHIVTEGETYVVREKISELAESLPDAGFARCHNSIIVNLSMIKEIHGGSVVMSDGTELLISRGHSRDFRLRYMNWAKSRNL